MSLQEKVYEELLEKKLRFSTAESCTGGMIASMMTSVPGVSAVYPGGFVTYCNEEKHRMLGVSSKLLETKGAVCKKTAAAMAKGAAKKVKADIAVSVTGNAGPDASEGKPVGRVYIGCAYRRSDNRKKYDVKVRKFDFEGDRREIREAAAGEALQLVLDILSEEFPLKIGDMDE